MHEYKIRTKIMLLFARGVRGQRSRWMSSFFDTCLSDDNYTELCEI
jgi:hypothetical protein